MEIPVLTAEIALICVIVLGAALYKTGLVGKIARKIVRIAGSNEPRTMSLLSVAVAIPSGIMSNVGTVTLMLLAALQVARQSGISPSRLVMPMGFCPNLGGTLPWSFPRP